MSTNVVFTTQSKSGLQSSIDLRFGRAEAFIFIDVDTGKIINQLSNNSVEATQGAGLGAAAMIASQKVKAVVSGSFGPKAFEALTKLNIEMWITSQECSVQETIKLFNSGLLKRMKMEVYE